MLNFFHSIFRQNPIDSSRLFDESTFYNAFIKDLQRCTKEVIIESPFITNSRAQFLRPIFQELIQRKVTVYIITRNPEELEEHLAVQSAGELAEFMLLGVQVIVCGGNHHRKLAILDRKILYEGSLNILSQNYSQEIMRRIESEQVVLKMFQFLQFKSLLSKK